MKLTYEMNVVFQELFGHIPCKVDDVNEKESQVILYFSRDLNLDLFEKNFQQLRGLAILNGNALTVMNRGLKDFSELMSKLYDDIEIELNLKKCRLVFECLKKPIKKIMQANSNICIFFRGTIPQDQFKCLFLLEHNEYDIFEDELLIYPQGLDKFKSTINRLHAEYASQLFLSNDAKQENTTTRFKNIQEFIALVASSEYGDAFDWIREDPSHIGSLFKDVSELIQLVNTNDRIGEDVTCQLIEVQSEVLIKLFKRDTDLIQLAKTNGLPIATLCNSHSKNVVTLLNNIDSFIQFATVTNSSLVFNLMRKHQDIIFPLFRNREDIQKLKDANYEVADGLELLMCWRRDTTKGLLADLFPHLLERKRKVVDDEHNQKADSDRLFQ